MTKKTIKHTQFLSTFSTLCQPKERVPILVKDKDIPDSLDKTQILHIDTDWNYLCPNSNWKYPLLSKKADKFYPCCYKRYSIKRHYLNEFLQKQTLSRMININKKARKADSILSPGQTGMLDLFDTTDTYYRFGIEHPTFLQCIRFGMKKDIVETIDKLSSWRSVNKYTQEKYDLTILFIESSNRRIIKTIPFYVTRETKRYIIVHCTQDRFYEPIMRSQTGTMLLQPSDPLVVSVLAWYKNLWTYGKNKEFLQKYGGRIKKQSIVYNQIVQVQLDDDRVYPLFPEVALYKQGIETTLSLFPINTESLSDIPGYDIVSKTPERVTFSNGLFLTNQPILKNTKKIPIHNREQTVYLFDAKPFELNQVLLPYQTSVSPGVEF